MNLSEKQRQQKIDNYKRELMNRKAARTTPVAYIQTRLPYKYWAIQKEIIEACFKNEFVTVKSCHASGKMELNGTPVLTSTGWTPIDKLSVGDSVISGVGTTTLVTGVFPHYNQPMYRLHFNDGTWIDVGGPHLWQVKTRAGRHGKQTYPYKYAGVVHDSPWEVKTTKEIFDFYQTMDRDNRHLLYELPPQPVVSLNKQSVPLNPYALGLLLGDGGMTTSNVTFSTADPELLDALPITKRRGDSYDYGTTGLVDPLRELGLLGKKSEYKFVPEAYLWNTENVRLAVLQGLMDTDGGISGVGIEFSSSSKQLALDVQFLVRSLGGYASITKRKTTHLDNYRIYIRMDAIEDAPIHNCPFRLTRKRKSYYALPTKKTTANRLIESVELLPKKADATCIAVGDPSHLYITKDFIITHNTFLAATVVLLFLEGYVPSKVMTTATTNLQIEALLWAEINTQFGKANPPYPWVWRILTKGIKIAPDHFALGFASDEEINFQGFHSVNFLLVADEAAGIAMPVFDALSTLMTGEHSRMLLISNPDSLTGYFYHSHEMAHFKKFTISAFDTPNFTQYGITMDDIRSGEWEEKMKDQIVPYPALITAKWVARKYIEWGGEGNPLFIAKVFGEFPTGAVDSLVPLDKINQAQRRKGSTHGENQWGFDVARLGNDSSTLWYRRGERVEIMKTFHKFDAVELVEWAGTLIRKVDPRAPIAVDAVGIGGPVADMLRVQKKLNVFEYTGAGKSADEDCFNQRSEFYWHLRKCFVTDHIAGRIDEDTKEELCATDYKIIGGKVRVIKKDQIKKKISRSPDKADGLMLCFAPIDNMSVIDDIIVPGGDKRKPKEAANEDVEFWYSQ